MIFGGVKRLSSSSCAVNVEFVMAIIDVKISIVLDFFHEICFFWGGGKE